MEEDLCGICLAPLADDVKATLECGHAFHQACMIQWFRCSSSRGRCPHCQDQGAASAAPQRVLEPDVDALVEPSPREMERILKHFLYHPQWRNDGSLAVYRDAFMAARRRCRRARSRGAHAAADSRARRQRDAAHALLTRGLLSGIRIYTT